MTENLSRKTAVELASLIASKAVSPVEVLDAHLATIARVNPRLDADRRHSHHLWLAAVQG